MPSGPKKRKAAKRKQQQTAIAGSPSNADSYADSLSNVDSPSNPNPIPDFKEVEGETEKVSSALQSEIPLRESESGCNDSRWQEFFKERVASQDRKLNESVHVNVEESKLNEKVVSYDEKQGQVSQWLDENIHTEEFAEVNGNLNNAFQEEPPVSFYENSGSMDLDIASKNQDGLLCMKTEKEENEDILFQESKVNEFVYVNNTESKISEQIFSCDDELVQVSPQLDEETCKEHDAEMNGNLDTSFQKKPPISFSEISDTVDLEIASENKDSLNCTKTNGIVNAPPEKLENEEMSVNDYNEAIGVSPSNEKYKEAEIYPFHIEKNLRLDERSILVCEEEDIKESAGEISLKQTDEIYILDNSKSSVGINPVIQPLTDVNLHGAELHKTTENTSKLVQSLACKEEILNRMASDNLDKAEEIQFVNENFNKPVDAVGEEPIVDMLDNKLDQSADQNTRIYNNSAFVPEEVELSKTVYRSLESLIRATDDSYLQSMEKPVENSSSNSELVQISAGEEEGLKRIVSDNRDKLDEIQFVNENFNKPADAVGGKPIADMLNNKLDQSADQNARLDDNSASVPEQINPSRNNYGSLESLIRAADDSYLQSMEEYVDNTSNTMQTGNMQRDEVDPKEPRQRSSFLKCCGLLEAFTSSDK